MTTCIDEIGIARCTGCFGCQSACDSGAIALILDGDGFYKPVVNRPACNDCGACRPRCPVLEPSERSKSVGKWLAPKAFAAWSLDDPTRLGSSSGGLFSELAGSMLAASGAVAGCVWGEDWSPEHILTRDPLQVERMRGSKYVPSHVGDVYRRVIATIRSGDNVLFCGAPCQVAAMERALTPKQRERVLLVEFICHGVPSLRVFHAYQRELFDGDEVAKYTFRDKSLGWQTVRAESVRGHHYQVEMPADPFGRGFAVEHLYLMEACHDCEFSHLPRWADITLGDFWGCPEEWYDRRGVSVALANTPAGLRAIESLASAGRIALEATDLATATERNPRATGGAFPVPGARRLFLDGISRGESFTRLAHKFYPSRLKLAWRAFRNSNSKTRYIVELVKRLVRRVLA